jgi:hypothetical protein
VTRRRRQDDSSLELLLDTICNTFGGILFLAMLVSLLLSQTQRKQATAQAAAPQQPALSPADAALLQRRATRLTQESARVEELLADVRRVAKRVSDSETDALLVELKESEAVNADLAGRQAAVLAMAADAQAAAARAASSAVQETNRLEAARGRADTARRRLEAASDARVRLAKSAESIQARLAAAATIVTAGKAPREKPTTKRELAVMLRYGRLYQMHRYSAGSRTVNLADFAVETGAAFNRARPRPTAGVDLVATGAAQRVAALFENFPRDRWHVCLVVHPDSFAEFLALKTWLVGQGYEYRLFPSADSVVDRGASPVDAKVQ